MAAAAHRAQAVDDTGEHFDTDDLYEELVDPETGVDDRIAAFDGATMVAFAGVRSRPAGDYLRVDAEGAVDPRRRGQGLGASLVHWSLQRGRDLQRTVGEGIETRVHSLAFLHNEAQVALLEGQGFRQVNWSAVMRAQLGSAAMPAPVWPSGLTHHTYGRSWSEATRAAHNDAFAGHWGFAAWSGPMWAQWVDDTKNARPELSWVVVDAAHPESVAGYLITNEFTANSAATGARQAYLAKLGVRPAFRGRGVATALLAHALRAYQADGLDETCLDVHISDGSGAFGLYERAGYRVVSRTATLELTLTPSL